MLKTDANVVILAAGHGTRMRSELPKVLHRVRGVPMVLWPVSAALGAGARRVVVVGGPDRALAPYLPDDVKLAVQHPALGTGHAVMCAIERLDFEHPVIVLAGDTPLTTSQFVAGLYAAHISAGAAATVVSAVLDDPTGYGRIVRGQDGAIERVVETKAPGDATEDELQIREVNTSIYCFDGHALKDALAQVRSDNAQGEYYLPDALALIAAHGGKVIPYPAPDPALILGINTPEDLAEVEAIAKARSEDFPAPSLAGAMARP